MKVVSLETRTNSIVDSFTLKERLTFDLRGAHRPNLVEYSFLMRGLKAIAR